MGNTSSSCKTRRPPSNLKLESTILNPHWGQHAATLGYDQCNGCIDPRLQGSISPDRWQCNWLEVSTLPPCCHHEPRGSVKPLKTKHMIIYPPQRPHIYQYTVWVKKIPPEVFWHFFTNDREFLVQILHTYYTCLSTLEYKFLFNYLQLWRSYAILSATTEFTSCAQNVHHRPKRTQCLHAQFVVVWYFTH